MPRRAYRRRAAIPKAMSPDLLPFRTLSSLQKVFLQCANAKPETTSSRPGQKPTQNQCDKVFGDTTPQNGVR